MHVVKVDEIPEKTHRGHKFNLYSLLDSFMELNTKNAMVVYDSGEYNNVNTAYGNLFQSAKYGGFPVQVIRRGDVIYLTRNDM